jgi:DNA-binding transcriptional MerR regulator
MIDSTHIYNLKAVIHEVGLSAATLRAWERRYGLLKPQRSQGGHRLYSRQDIEMLRWLVQKQKEGLSISHAVEMWKSLHEGDPVSPVPETTMGEGILDGLRERWISACTAFDDQAANRTLDHAFAVAAPETICTEVLQKGLAQIGAGWYAGSNSVQQEHFASAIAIRRVNSLVAAVTPPTRVGHILAACPPGEEHDFILLLATYLLRRAGWDVIYLGANVPLEDLEATIQATKPVMVISAAQTLNSVAALRTMSEFLLTRGISLAYGGGFFTQVPESTQCITGYYLGTNIAMLSKMLEQLVIEPPSMPIAQPVSPEYAQTLKILLQNEAVIASHVGAQMQTELIEPAYLEIANVNLTRMVASALMLGDINLLEPSIEWLNGLLENRGFSASVVQQFYAAYLQAVQRNLGDEGIVILGWISRLKSPQWLKR